MGDLAIVPADIRHAYRLAANLREGDRGELEAAGAEPRRIIRSSMRQGILCRTALIGGEVACMWGLGGALISDVGQPWLLTTPLVERMPLALIREGRRQVEAMLRLRRVLRNYVWAEYAKAIGLLRLFGFTVHEPKPFGPKGAMFSMFEMERS